jgi:hypothetical protein
MTGDYAAEPPPGRHLGLESVKKTLQVVWVGTGSTVAPPALINIDLDQITLSMNRVRFSQIRICH